MSRSTSMMLPLWCKASEASAWRWKEAKSPWRSDGEAANASSLPISPMISRSTSADKVRASLLSSLRTSSNCASPMLTPAYAPNSSSGTMTAHPSTTSRCHNGRGLRSAGIAPIRKMIPLATQGGPTADGRGGGLTDERERVDAGQVAEQAEQRDGAGEAAEHGRGQA